MIAPETSSPWTSPAPSGGSGGHDWRLGRFPNLMPRRIEEILLVSSEYDSFMLEEDGLLTEMIFSEYMHLGLTHAPNVTRVGSGEEALAALRAQRYDLVITMLRLSDMDIHKFNRALRELNPAIPVVLLIANELELGRLEGRRDELDVDGIYVWHGDAKIFLAIIKVLEDEWNVAHDTQVGGVGVIILVEDSVRYRSSFLPIMYTEIVNQTRSVMLDGINRMHKLLRMRARPKILIAETFEEGLALYERYQDYLFGVITDVSFERDGKVDPHAGIEFVRTLKRENPDLPALVQSSDLKNRELAQSIGTSFLHKRSNTLLRDLRDFILANFGFGDFVFRLPPEGRECGRAWDLRSMARVLREIPAESLEYHARRNHFSNWLRARTEFVLARRLRPRSVSEFRDLESLRRYLINAFEEALRQNRRGVIEDFDRARYDSTCHFARIGGGSLGGKARGLAFMDALLARHNLDRAFPGVRVFVPRSAVIGTEVFDQFLEANDLHTPSLFTLSDRQIRQRFLDAPLPEAIVKDLGAYLQSMRYPLAVRSSSQLEDSTFHPFAGVFETHMLPNNHPDDQVRLQQLCNSVKLVYASAFLEAARRYTESTPHHIDEQRMAVILQQMVGTHHQHFFYPSFSGVTRSYNFYPFGHMRPEEGVAFVALGLGKQIVEGGDALRFCPAHPQVLPQLADGNQFLSQSQRAFFALDVRQPDTDATGGETVLARLELEDAERHGTLAPLGSTWSPENQAFYDGIYRPGVRAVTFAHVLKSDIFPLAAILERILEISAEGMGGAVELEFAVELGSDPQEFAILQMRPYAPASDVDPIELGDVPRERLLLYSGQALGNGIIDGVEDVIYVRPQRFDAGRTTEIAREVARLNERLRAEKRHCVLLGPGRWGSSNTWLGVPVNWGQISTARVIVETGLENFKVDPSQGSHFFQNLTAVGTAYLTVNSDGVGSFVDWAWLDEQPALEETDLLRLVRLAHPLEVRVDGRLSRAVILKTVERPEW